MVDVPPATPETMPEVPIVAMPVLTLLQFPPVVALANGVVAPWQSIRVPVIADGNALTVIVAVLTHPPGDV